jgi:hypothetical protein
MSIEELRYQIVARLDRGEDIAAIDTELIKPAPWLSEDERAALWLFAWSYREQFGAPIEL